MAELKESFEVSKKFAPEIADILDFQVTGQYILLKPSLEEDLKTKGGIIMSGTTSDNIRFSMLQTATIVNIGPKVEELKAGMIVYYHLKDCIYGEVKDGEGNLYLLIQDYAIKGYIK